MYCGGREFLESVRIDLVAEGFSGFCRNCVHGEFLIFQVFLSRDPLSFCYRIIFQSWLFGVLRKFKYEFSVLSSGPIVCGGAIVM